VNHSAKIHPPNHLKRPLHLSLDYDIINRLKLKKRRAVPGFGKGRKVGG